MNWKQGNYIHGPQPIIVYQLHHLKQKPLRYFTNVGRVHHGVRQQAIKKIKKVCEFRLANGIEYLTYYQLGRIRFPFQCQWLGDRGCELSIWEPAGSILIFSKIIKVKKNQRIPEKNLHELGQFLKELTDKISTAMRSVEIKPQLSYKQ
jgi:hypothetical protein